jgi:trimethylamine--corrinoid protein Co-methyltransferase
VLQFVGLIESLLAFDYGMAVVDNEIALMLKRTYRGLEFSEENLALNEIGAVGPGGMFLTTERTLANMASAAFFPSVANRETRHSWQQAGAHDAYTVSLRKAKEIIQEHGPELFDAEIDQRVRATAAGMVPGDFSMPAGW